MAWRIGSKDFADRRVSIIEAGKRRDSDYLIAVLVDPDLRWLAAKLLGELGVVEATDDLLRLLPVADPYVRAWAATALGQLRSEQALPQLRALAVHDEEAFVRSRAIWALGEIGDPDGVDLLLPLLRDRSARVRASAAMTLGHLADPSSLPPIRAARPRLLRAPVDWYLNRDAYDGTISALERQAGRQYAPRSGEASVPKKDETYPSSVTHPTWYHVALARKVDRRTRLRAWKRILAWEFVVVLVVLVGTYLLPESVFDSDWELLLLVAATVLFVGGLAYSQRQRR